MSSPIMLRVRECGALLRVDRSTVLRRIYGGELPALQLGRSWRIPVAALEDATADVVERIRAQLDAALPPDPYLLPLEVRRVLRCSPGELHLLALPSVSLGGQRRYQRSLVLDGVVRLIQQRKESPHG